MPALVRLKRRIDEEPLTAFVLNGRKKQKIFAEGNNCGSTETNNKDETISTILKFAGTVDSQDDSPTTQLARLTKVEAKELVKKARKPKNVTERTRHEMRQNMHESRFKVVNCFRTTLENEENNAEASTKEITIVDIEKQQTQPPVSSTSESSFHNVEANPSTSSNSNISQQPTDSDTGYVYDLYLPENEQQAENVDLMDDNHLSYIVRPFDDLVYEDRFNNDSDNEFDSEDSNHENYMGNDYPDDDDDLDDESNESVQNRKICRAMKKFKLVASDDNNSLETLSSDDEDNPYINDEYVYTVEEDEEGFIDDVDRYGSAYARYKARVLKDLDDDTDEDDDEG